RGGCALRPELICCLGNIFPLPNTGYIIRAPRPPPPPGIPSHTPPPADPACDVDDSDPPDPGLAQLGAGDHAGDPGTHDGDVDVVGKRVAPGVGSERILQVVRERSLAREIPDLGAPRDHALPALFLVLCVDRFGIEAPQVAAGLGHGARPSLSPSLPTGHRRQIVESGARRGTSPRFRRERAGSALIGTFAGIRPVDVPAFIAAQLLGALGGAALPAAGARGRARKSMKTVIFACVHNSGRSQMAAASLHAMADANLADRSAVGPQPGSAGASEERWRGMWLRATRRESLVSGSDWR